MEHRVTPKERGFLPASDAVLVERTFGFEALSKTNATAEGPDNSIEAIKRMSYGLSGVKFEDTRL